MLFVLRHAVFGALSEKCHDKNALGTPTEIASFGSQTPLQTNADGIWGPPPYAYSQDMKDDYIAYDEAMIPTRKGAPSTPEATEKAPSDKVT